MRYGATSDSKSIKKRHYFKMIFVAFTNMVKSHKSDFFIVAVVIFVLKINVAFSNFIAWHGTSYF